MADQKTQIFEFENATWQKSYILAAILTLIFFRFFGGRFLLPPKAKRFQSDIKAENITAIIKLPIPVLAHT